MEIVIPKIPPSVNHYNNYRSRNGKIFVANTKETKDFKDDIQKIWFDKYGQKPTKEKLEVWIIITFPDNRKRDLDNYSKVLFDSLTGYAWEDDSQIWKLHLEKKIKKNIKQVLLKIKPISEQCMKEDEKDKLDTMI